LKTSAVPDGYFIGEGYKTVRRMLEHAKIEKILLTPEWHEEFGDRIPPDAEAQVVKKKDVEKIVGFRLHQGVLAMARIPEPPAEPPKGLVVALDGIADAENVGAILRTCAAFGVDGVLVGPGTCSPWVRRAVRVSLGAPLRVPVHATDDLAATIRSLDFPAYAAHIHGDRTTLEEAAPAPPCCLVLGGEADGVSKPVLDACRKTIYIRMAEGWDCLNVAASAAVLLYAVTMRCST
jgi:tRNA G18 (ribose-2'-O)-methylase SpoU